MRHSRLAQSSKNKRMKQRVLVGIVSVSALVTLSMSVAFADVDLEAKIKAWADKQTSAAISSLNTAIQSETEIQKRRLQEELQVRLDRQASELSAFTENEKQKQLDTIRQYANDLLANASFSNTAEENQLKEQIALIVANAQAAIDQVNAAASTSLPEASEEPAAPESIQP